MIGHIKDLMRGRNGEYCLTLQISSPDVEKLYDELNGEILQIDIKKYRKKRSLDANAYAWVLIDKLAKHYSVDKADVYRATVREIGGTCEILCVQDKAVDQFCKNWKSQGLGWQTESFPSKIDGCTNVVVFYGSSVYDSKQMHELIQSLERDCEDAGIPTAIDQEIYYGKR